MNAKVKYQAEDALKLLDKVDELYAAKGKSVTRLDLKKDKPDRQTLLGLLLGPTGNLRAPAFRTGKTLFVGFNEEAYAKVFK